MSWQELGTSSPNAASVIDYLVRAGGAHLLVLGLLSLAVSLTGLRRGERWAWYAMWLWPLWLVSILLLLLGAYKQPGPGLPPPLVSGSVFLVVTLITLALSYRNYFPRQQPDRASFALLSQRGK